MKKSIQQLIFVLILSSLTATAQININMLNENQDTHESLLHKHLQDVKEKKKQANILIDRLLSFSMILNLDKLQTLASRSEKMHQDVTELLRAIENSLDEDIVAINRNKVLFKLEKNTLKSKQELTKNPLLLIVEILQEIEELDSQLVKAEEIWAICMSQIFAFNDRFQQGVCSRYQ